MLGALVNLSLSKRKISFPDDLSILPTQTCSAGFAAVIAVVA